MLKPLLSFAGILYCLMGQGQTASTISGTIFDATNTQKPLADVTIGLEGTTVQARSLATGAFSLTTTATGTYSLLIATPDFSTKTFSIVLTGELLDLGSIYLEPDITIEQQDNLITMTENELSDDEGTQSSPGGLLQATKDLFLRRAAFDFGQAFFRVRGYDSREGQVLINGIEMNKVLDGRPQWNNWGGLNDVIRNQEFSNGLDLSKYTFGGILGNTNIDTRPSGMRPGVRLSSSLSNRTYAGRVMVTYSSGLEKNKLAYTFSASRRWAKEGFIAGTLYDAYSLFGALEYQMDQKNTLALTAVFARNRRGRSSAITEEVFELTGNDYNPYWGMQDGKIRNSRERLIAEPVFMLNHFYKSDKLSINTGVAYQTGTRKRSRLGFYNAPNPDPTYFRYLPSFYINNPIGADFTNAELAREGFLNNPQVNWQQVHTANSGPENMGRAAYVLYDDTVDDTQITAASTASITLGTGVDLILGGTYKNLDSHNYAQILDLLGADHHADIDPFSNTLNDVNGTLEKTSGDIFNYSYDLGATEWNGFMQLELSKGALKGGLSGSISETEYLRDGRFQNERFLEDSMGKSNRLRFSAIAAKAELSYQITGRHWLQGHIGTIQRAPTLQNVFINPRESNAIVPNIQKERVFTGDMGYFIRLPELTGRLTGFYSRFYDITDINFFFVDAGVGSDFVQEVITDMDKLHMGIELGLEYEASPQVKLSFAANWGKYTYANDPNLTINFDTAGAEEDLIDPEGSIDLGAADLNGLRLAQGPQTAISLGVEYRNPKYWWFGATANYLTENYANVSAIIRTESFLLDPETGEPFPDATSENVSRLLRQDSLDSFYLLNLVGGKSWLIHGKYISVFASINNAFDAIFRTGGYEQSRNGNFGQLQQDNLRNDPSFAPKYWYGFGRTFFLNVAVSF